MQHLRFMVGAMVFLSGCSIHGSGSAERADVPVRDGSGRDIGTLTITSQSSGLMLTGTVRGLPPGTHGIHLHAVGLCEPPFTSAGAHWNPTGRQHGAANPQGPHLGDMPNIVVADDGTATVSVMTSGGTLSGTNALLDADGAAVVIHAGPDDYRTDPSGNSGARIACGVVHANR
jgi:superoxide dismutase, Cu-Zn family